MAMTPKEIIAVVQHFDAGGEVECRELGKTKWLSVVAPVWNFKEFDYRPKPKPLELWANIYPDGTIKNTCIDPDLATETCGNVCRTVHMREVVDEDS